MMKKLTDFFLRKRPDVAAFGVRVLIALIVFVLGRMVIKWIRKLVRESLRRTKVDKGVEQFLDSFLKFGLYTLLILGIISSFGVSTTSVAAVVASGGVAVGLALQGSLSNFAGGILILLLKPFEVGDYIIEDSHQREGTVKEIQIFYTRLLTVDNKTVVIPNGMLTNNSLVNVTACQKRKLDLRVSITYEADLRKAKDILREIVSEDQEAEKEGMAVFVDELGDSAVIIGVRTWVKTEAYFEAKWRILEQVKLRFDREGVAFAYPQLVIHQNR